MRVIVVTGASGGHIFPATAFLDGLKAEIKDLDACLVLPRKSIIRDEDDLGFALRRISLSSGSRDSIRTKIILLFNFLRGTAESLLILLKFNPDIIVGFGSLTSIPLVFLGWLSRTRTLIHEQNVSPGEANKFMANFADRIAISFRESEKYFRKQKRKLILTGNPLRQSISRIDRQKACDFFGLAQDKFTVLVMGGSQGSHRLNFAFLEAAERLNKKPAGLQIIHLSGANDFACLEEAYNNKKVSGVRLFSLLKEMSFAYSLSDLVVSRAGATSIAEIIFFNLPAIIIPYPYAGGHQALNARILEERGAALVIEDSLLDHGKLAQSIETLLNAPDRLRQMRSGYRELNLRDANNLLTQEVISSQRI